MPTTTPPLSAELSAFVESGLSVLVGTCGPGLMPESVRGVGVAVLEGGRAVRVFVPAANGARALANLRDNGRIAVTMTQPSTHRTLQVKGTVTALRDAEPADRALLERYLLAFSADLATLGMSPALVLRMCNWPAVAVDFTLVDVFDQTPGPGAGERLTGAHVRTP